MNLERRIKAFTKLGDFIAEIVNSYDENGNQNSVENEFVNEFRNQIKLASEKNAWFTKTNILFNLKSWSEQLTEEKIREWGANYNIEEVVQKTVAIVMAGNIPLVGFHDFISVLLSGHRVLVKQSSNDKNLLPYLAQYLKQIEPEFKDLIEFTESKLENFDAVIATGSNNTARYFEYYFRGKPSIIRKNRNSVAILSGKESEEDLGNLSEDIFRYYGLGCRNVSKIYVPKNYNFDAFFNGIYHWKDLVNEHKYANNYDYNKAVYLMSEFDILDNGFFMIKEDQSLGSPIATLFYEYYSDEADLQEKINSNRDNIQCIVANGLMAEEINFGETQNPSLNDYADNVDTIEFLSNL
ncbi:Acyl-CoA reductase (LuxC) [Flavobacteriaceae bacterium MAR_2010_188]|nr:Acyl-CoA reductase (LuxC) [Flavobacteriaceae bacterium MAR_2010_188]